jgi:hypothetical protein
MISLSPLHALTARWRDEAAMPPERAVNLDALSSVADSWREEAATLRKRRAEARRRRRPEVSTQLPDVAEQGMKP